MNVAFIVQLNLDDLSGLADVAQEINQDLSDAGFEVKSVMPWQRPSLGGGLFSPVQPQQQQTNPNPIT